MLNILGTQLPITSTPLSEGEASGSQSLDSNQRSAKIGEMVPIVFCKRVGNSGGALVSPPATECRFEVYDDFVDEVLRQHVRVYYMLVVSEGEIDRLQVRDVFQQSCRVGSSTTAYNTRSGDWVPGNFLPNDIDATRFCGTGGTYDDLSVLSFINGIPSDFDQWRKQVHCFVRGGIHVVRLIDGIKGSSNNYADLALYLLRESVRLDDSSIDLAGYLAAAQFLQANQFNCDTIEQLDTSMSQWLQDTAGQFLLRRSRINGKETLRSLVQANSNGTINTGFVRWTHTFINRDIAAFNLTYTPLTDRKPFCVLVMWRQQPDDDIGLIRTTEVRYYNTADAGPYEQHDLSKYVTNENHAVKVAAYILGRRRYIEHSLELTLTSGSFNGSISIGDIVRVNYVTVDNNGQTLNHDYLYEVEAIDKSLTGLIQLDLVHFPIDSQGRSLIALDVSRANGSGILFPTGRQAVSCDFNDPFDIDPWPELETPDWNIDFEFDFGIDVPVGLSNWTFDLNLGIWNPDLSLIPNFDSLYPGGILIPNLNSLFPDGVDPIVGPSGSLDGIDSEGLGAGNLAGSLPDEGQWDDTAPELPAVTISDTVISYKYNEYYFWDQADYAIVYGRVEVSQAPLTNFEIFLQFGDETYAVVIPSARSGFQIAEPPYEAWFAVRSSISQPFFCESKQLSVTGWRDGGFAEVQLPTEPLSFEICPYVGTVTANSVVISEDEPYIISGEFEVNNLPVGDTLEIALALGNPLFKYSIRYSQWEWTGSGRAPEEPQLYVVEIPCVQSRITEDWAWDVFTKQWLWRRPELPVQGSPPASLPEPEAVTFTFDAPDEYVPELGYQLFIAYVRQGGFSSHVAPILGGEEILTEVTATETLVPPLEVDGETAFIDLEIAGLIGVVTKVVVTIDFTKTGNAFTYNSEIGFTLYHPDPLIFADVAAVGTFIGQNGNSVSAIMTFADEFPPFSAPGLVSGSYQPSDSFSIFNGEVANGTWRLEAIDDTPFDPMFVNSVSLTVFT